MLVFDPGHGPMHAFPHHTQGLSPFAASLAPERRSGGGSQGPGNALAVREVARFWFCDSEMIPEHFLVVSVSCVVLGDGSIRASPAPP
jgi:hypothetical protein